MTQDKYELSENWWQDISTDESVEWMKKIQIYGHDQGPDREEVLEMWELAGKPVVEVEEVDEEEVKRQFKEMADYQALKGVDKDQYSFDKALVLFKEDEGREPDLTNNFDTMVVSAIQLGVKSMLP